MAKVTLSMEATLCKDLNLSIYREDDQLRIVLENDLEEITECYPINQTTPKSRRYHIMEATTICLRRVVSEAFRKGLITDSLGTWMISRTATEETLSTLSETEWAL